MLYFIPWVVFFLLAVLAIPIAMMMDKKKARVDFGDDGMDQVHDEFAEDDALEDVEDQGEVAEEVEAVDDFGAEPLADDGFGATEEFAEFE